MPATSKPKSLVPATAFLPVLFIVACGQSIQGVDHAPWAQVVVTELGDAQIIDARTAQEYDAGHVPGAANVHWTQLTGTSADGLWDALPRDELATVFGDQGISSDAPVVVYGSGPDGYGDDGNVYWALRWLGHPDVRVLDGGWQAYVASGGAPETGSGPGATTYIASADDSVYADTTDVETWSGPILDVRSDSEWQAGHIPGATWLEWNTVFDTDQTLLPEDQLRSLYADLGITGEQPVVTYCRSGVRAGHTFMVLDALGLTASNYVGSWTRWTEDGGEIVVP